MARPISITKEVVQKVCDELADGKSLAQVCRMESMPSRSGFLYAVQRDDELYELYARARAIGAEMLGDQIVAIASASLDAVDPKARMAEVQSRKLLIDALKWTVGRAQPKGLRNKAEDTANNGNVVISWQANMDDVSARKGDDDTVVELLSEAG